MLKHVALCDTRTFAVASLHVLNIRRFTQLKLASNEVTTVFIKTTPLPPVNVQQFGDSF